MDFELWKRNNQKEEYYLLCFKSREIGDSKGFSFSFLDFWTHSDLTNHRVVRVYLHKEDFKEEWKAVGG